MLRFKGLNDNKDYSVDLKDKYTICDTLNWNETIAGSTMFMPMFEMKCELGNLVKTETEVKFVTNSGKEILLKEVK